jgi:Kef-type K+ transport system membrane component KefB
MIESLEHIISKIHLPHLNLLLLVGLALFGGIIGGRFFQKLRIPQVLGYIMIGIIIGKTGLRLVDENVIMELAPLNYFALGLIGFMVGGDLKAEAFKRYGKNFASILLCEGISPFILVTVSVGIVGTALYGHNTFVWALALLLGAIASATDPATTTSVLKEYRTKGPLTTNILGIVALDDGLALLLFAIASSIAGALIGQAGEGLFSAIFHPVYEIGGAVIIGWLSGLALTRLLIKYGEKDRILAFSIGVVLFVTGLSLTAKVSMLLAAMTLGITVVNMNPRKSKDAFGLVESFTPPIYVLFFVLVGARLELGHITFPILMLILTYLVFGLSGKMAGAWIGARVSRAAPAVRKYLPFGLFSQAGIAIGLSILAAQHFQGEVGNTLIVVIAATTFVTQIIGPPFTKLAVTRAGEVGLDITEEDLIQRTKAYDFMEKDPPLIYENMQLTDILKIFTENDNLSYAVVNRNKRLQGIITVDGIKQSILDTDISGLILAHDLMCPVIAKTTRDTPASEVKEKLDRHNIDHLPVVGEGDELEGFIERKKLNKFISTKYIELQEHTDSLG